MLIKFILLFGTDPIHWAFYGTLYFILFKYFIKHLSDSHIVMVPPDRIVWPSYYGEAHKLAPFYEKKANVTLYPNLDMSSWGRPFYFPDLLNDNLNPWMQWFLYNQDAMFRWGNKYSIKGNDMRPSIDDLWEGFVCYVPFDNWVFIRFGMTWAVPFALTFLRENYNFLILPGTELNWGLLRFYSGSHQCIKWIVVDACLGSDPLLRKLFQCLVIPYLTGFETLGTFVKCPHGTEFLGTGNELDQRKLLATLRILFWLIEKGVYPRETILYFFWTAQWDMPDSTKHVFVKLANAFMKQHFPLKFDDRKNYTLMDDYVSGDKGIDNLAYFFKYVLLWFELTEHNKMVDAVQLRDECPFLFKKIS